jgi:hypothetical protein
VKILLFSTPSLLGSDKATNSAMSLAKAACCASLTTYFRILQIPLSFPPFPGLQMTANHNTKTAYMFLTEANESSNVFFFPQVSLDFLFSFKGKISNLVYFLFFPFS